MAENTAGRDEIQLVVGLGNPGDKYSGTRHNIGFDVLDYLVGELDGNWQNKSSWHAQYYNGSGILFLKPMTFMNLSGVAVAAVSRFYRIKASQVLTVYDDAALPLGRLRIKRSGSSGGHNGMQSIINHLHTEQLSRLRVGVGAATNAPLQHHVLSKFSSVEAPKVRAITRTAAQAISHILKKGIDAAMNIYNKDPIK